MLREMLLKFFKRKLLTHSSTQFEEKLLKFLAETVFAFNAKVTLTLT